MPIRQPTSQEVQDLRLAHHMSAVEFGDIVYASGAAVSSWEAGRRAIPMTSWELLLVYFGKAAPRVHAGATMRPSDRRALQRDLGKTLDCLDTLRKSLTLHLS